MLKSDVAESSLVSSLGMLFDIFSLLASSGGGVLFCLRKVWQVFLCLLIEVSPKWRNGQLKQNWNQRS